VSFSEVVCTECQKPTAQRKIWPHKSRSADVAGSWRCALFVHSPSGALTRLTCRGTRVIEARVPHFWGFQRLRIRFHLSVISGVIQ